MGKTLSIETGIHCNNRCSFCYQLGWRTQAQRRLDPDTETLKTKLAWGRENGYVAVGFSGGEPTIRPDFLELIDAARELGYERISLTTNGRRFGNPEFTQKALLAGLDSIGWSLHGPTAKMHDGLVGRPGAFDQLVRGLANVEQESSRQGLHIDQNLFMLVNRVNHEHLAEICRLGRSYGIKLMVMQPVIYSKGNLSVAAGHRLELHELIASVRTAARSGQREEWFVKLFNLPPCFFGDMLSAFEHQRYPVRILRLQEEQAGSSAREAGNGSIRLDRCKDCLLPEFCPGLHQSLIPQSDLLRLATASLPSSKQQDEVMVAGTELFSAKTLTLFLRTLRERYEARRLRLYHAGDSVAGPDFTAAAIAGGMTHLSLVHTAAARQGTEMAALTGGNALALATVASSPLLRSPTGVTVAVSVPYIDADRSELVGRLAPLIQAGIKHLELHLPWDFKNPEVFELVKFARIFLAWKRLGGRSGELVYGSPAQSGTLLFRLPFEFFQMRCNAGNRFVQHFGSSSMADWIALSVPPALRRPKKHAGRNSEFILDGLPGKAITQSEIDVMRPG